MGDDEMIPAEVAQVLLQDKIAKLLKTMMEETQKTAELVRSQIVEGVVEPLETVTVTTSPTTVFPPYAKMGKYWFSVSIVNDGDATCYVVINTEKSSTTPYELRASETCEIDMGTAKIRDLYLYTESGTASLRIRGLR